MRHFFYFIFLFISAFSLAQQTDYVDFKTAKVDLNKFNIDEKWVGGKVDYTFDILKQVDSIYLDSKNIYGYIVFLNDKEVEYYVDDGKLWIIDEFRPSKNNKLSIEFNAMTKKAIYFVGWQDEAPNQIWTQGQGKYTSNWLPSMDDTNDKIEFDLSITFDKKYEVISNGKLINKEVGKKTTKWIYDMKQPMSSYLVALAIGEYNKKVEVSKSGIPLEMYYYPEDSLKVEPTYRYTKQMFDFLEKEIGVDYPWQNYKQVPVHDFLYAGMENTSCTIFSDAFMIDETAFVDKNYVNVNAHELAHQWFGDLVTATSSEHHWLQEGFATYYALLAERDLFGEDYFYWRLYEYAQELLAQDEAGNSTALLNPKSSSITFYKKGAWVLHVLREKVGDKAFKKAVKCYLKSNKYSNVESDDFIDEVEKASGEDLTKFVEDWLQSSKLQIEEMRLSLDKNETTSFLITIEENPYLSYRKNNNDDYVPSSLINGFPKGFYPIKIAVLEELLTKPEYPTYDDLIAEVFESRDIKLRQAMAQLFSDIPSDLKQEYESLLSDKSYITIETTLYNLWNNFPEDRVRYLDQTKDVVGFNTKNVRLLWLVLALSTPEYQSEKSKTYYDELVGYTSPEYNFELRQNAFQYLLMLKSCRTECLKNLKQATGHHNWRLSKFAKEQIELINTN